MQIRAACLTAISLKPARSRIEEGGRRQSPLARHRAADNGIAPILEPAAPHECACHAAIGPAGSRDRHLTE